MKAAFQTAYGVPGDLGVKEVPRPIPADNEVFVVYPNPLNGREVSVTNTRSEDLFSLHNAFGAQVPMSKTFDAQSRETVLRLPAGLTAGLYVLSKNDQSKHDLKIATRSGSVMILNMVLCTGVALCK